MGLQNSRASSSATPKGSSGKNAPKEEEDEEDWDVDDEDELLGRHIQGKSTRHPSRNPRNYSRKKPVGIAVIGTGQRIFSILLKLTLLHGPPPSRWKKSLDSRKTHEKLDNSNSEARREAAEGKGKEKEEATGGEGNEAGRKERSDSVFLEDGDEIDMDETGLFRICALCDESDEAIQLFKERMRYESIFQFRVKT
jgi:hypothetical protein